MEALTNFRSDAAMMQQVRSTLVRKGISTKASDLMAVLLPASMHLPVTQELLASTLDMPTVANAFAKHMLREYVMFWSIDATTWTGQLWNGLGVLRP